MVTDVDDVYTPDLASVRASRRDGHACGRVLGVGNGLIDETLRYALARIGPGTVE